jgi:hypothetical protein
MYIRMLICTYVPVGMCVCIHTVRYKGCRFIMSLRMAVAMGALSHRKPISARNLGSVLPQQFNYLISYKSLKVC